MPQPRERRTNRPPAAEPREGVLEGQRAQGVAVSRQRETVQVNARHVSKNRLTVWAKQQRTTTAERTKRRPLFAKNRTTVWKVGGGVRAQP
jgi:hypothetical protein